MDFKFKGKTLTEYTNLFFSDYFKKNSNIILIYFKYESKEFYWRNSQKKLSEQRKFRLSEIIKGLIKGNHAVNN